MNHRYHLFEIKTIDAGEDLIVHVVLTRKSWSNTAGSGLLLSSELSVHISLCDIRESLLLGCRPTSA